MATQSNIVALTGSDRKAVPGSKVIGPVHPDERVLVTVRLRPRTRSQPRRGPRRQPRRRSRIESI